MKNEIKHTAHSTYRCEYHIVFAPKYRRKYIYGQIKKDVGEIIRKLCKEKKVEILEAEACPDHIHMLVSVPPYLSIAQFMGYPPFGFDQYRNYLKILSDYYQIDLISLAK